MARLNFLISRFQMDVNTRKRFDFSVSELRYSLFEFNSRKNSLTFDEMEYEWRSLKQREFTVCVTFSLPSLRKLPSSPKLVCGQYKTLTEAQVAVKPAVNFPNVDSNFFILWFPNPLKFGQETSPTCSKGSCPMRISIIRITRCDLLHTISRFLPEVKWGCKLGLAWEGDSGAWLEEEPVAMDNKPEL